MSGLAVIVLKFPSLLRFDQKMRGGESPAEADNLNSLFGVARPPCDSGLRKRLDRVGVREIRGCFKALFALLRRGKALERFTVLGGHHPVSLDGTGFHSSGKVRCDACRGRRRGGTVSYCHQMPGAALVHPDTNTVFPLAPEMILKQDGADKNDCERNAAARFIRDFRRGHPHLKTIILQDGLASNGPHIKLLQSRNLRFIIGAKPKDHKFLFKWVEDSPGVSVCEKTEKTPKGVILHSFSWLNGAPLNGTHFGEKVNFPEHR